MCSLFIRGENLKVVFEVIVLQSAEPPAEWERRGALHFISMMEKEKVQLSEKKTDTTFSSKYVVLTLMILWP